MGRFKTKILKRKKEEKKENKVWPQKVKINSEYLEVSYQQKQ